jgi:hypothetical protein
MKNLKEKFRKIDFIFVFLLFLIPVIFFAKQGDYPLIVVFLVIAAALSKARYNWVYFSQEYRDGVKKKMFEKTPFSQKWGWGHVEGSILMILFLTIFFFYCLYSGEFVLAIGAFVFDLLFIALLYTFIKF